VANAWKQRMTPVEGVSLGGGGEDGSMYVSQLIKCSTQRTTTLQANNNLGYIGAAIVGSFIAILIVWYGITWLARKVKKNRVATAPE
jgi:hypothetical protein